MRADHLKGWLEESQNEEAAAAKVKVVEGEVEVIRGPGEKETEGKMEMETEAMMHWEKVVALVRAAFREGRLA